MAEPKPYDVIAAENDILRKRLAEIEARHKRNEPAPAPATAADPNLMRLIQQKDKALHEYTAELEARASALETMIEELNGKNLEATNHLRTVELYKSIVENEPAAIIGVDSNRMIVLFNQGAIKLLGAKIAGAIFSPLEVLNLADYCPALDELLNDAFDNRRHREASHKRPVSNINYDTITYPIIDNDIVRGAIVRISS